MGSTEGRADAVDVFLTASCRENVELRMAAAEHAGHTAKIMDQAVSQESTSIELKKAVLIFEVTPQITLDDRIIMNQAVRNDNVGRIFFEDAPSINTREVQTQVLVGQRADCRVRRHL